MKLRDFLVSAGTEKNLAELILFLSEQAHDVRKGFLCTCMKDTVDEKTRNMYGEEQMPLDKYADAVFIAALRSSRLVRYIATEEQDTVLEIDNPRNNFGVVIDPLDGSSLIDVNLCTGSILGIYPGHVLEKGSAMVAALYILYGPLTSLTLTTGKGVHEFVLDNDGEFVLKQQDIRIPEGKIYAPGALRKDYLPAHARWIAHLEHAGYKTPLQRMLCRRCPPDPSQGGCLHLSRLQGTRKGKTAPALRGKSHGEDHP